jgi:hypothetical protein
VATIALASLSDGKLTSDMDDLAYWLRIPKRDAIATLNALLSVGLVDAQPEGYFIHDWHEWQFTSDNSTRRSQESRKRKKVEAPQRNVAEPPPGNVAATLHCNDAATVRAEQNQIQTIAEHTQNDFESFFALYPKPVKREAAWRAFHQNIRTAEERQLLTAGLERWLASDQWTRSMEGDGGRFIPDPDRFIAERRYLETPSPKQRDALAVALEKLLEDKEAA